MRYAPLLLLAVFLAALTVGCPPPEAGPKSPAGAAGSPTDGGKAAP